MVFDNPKAAVSRKRQLRPIGKYIDKDLRRTLNGV